MQKTVKGYRPSRLAPTGHVLSDHVDHPHNPDCAAERAERVRKLTEYYAGRCPTCGRISASSGPRCVGCKGELQPAELSGEDAEGAATAVCSVVGGAVHSWVRANGRKNNKGKRVVPKYLSMRVKYMTLRSLGFSHKSTKGVGCRRARWGWRGKWDAGEELGIEPELLKHVIKVVKKELGYD